MQSIMPTLKYQYFIPDTLHAVFKCNSLAEWLIKNKSGRIGKGSGRGEVTADEVTHLLEGVRMTDVPGLEEAHKEGLQEGTLGGAITEGSFTGDDGRAEGTFGMIIIRGDEWIGRNCIAK